MSFGIVGMLTARNSLRTKKFFQGMGLTQDKVAHAVTEFRRSKIEPDTIIFKTQQTLKEMEKNILLREENEQKQASKEANKQANEQARLAKQQRREQALISKPKKVIVPDLKKLSTAELKKELGRLAREKREREQRALRDEQRKQETEKKAAQAAIDRQKTEERKAKELAEFRAAKAKAKQDNGLIQRYLEQEAKFEAHQEMLSQRRKMQENERNNMMAAIRQLEMQLNS